MGTSIFLYPHVNEAGTGIIVFVPVDTSIRYTLNLNSKQFKKT